MSIKSVFFDLDGTLLDTARDLGAALNATLQHHQKETLPESSIRPHVSNGANALIRLGFGESIDETLLNIYRQYLLDYYYDHIAVDTVAFDGINTLIEHLMQQNIAWGIATNKPWRYTEKLMRYFSFASQPIGLICPEHVTHKKPAADSLTLACELSHCTANELVYIGDHIRDIECGKNIGCHTIAAAYGYLESPEQADAWDAHYTVYDGQAIWPIIKELNS